MRGPKSGRADTGEAGATLSRDISILAALGDIERELLGEGRWPGMLARRKEVVALVETLPVVLRRADEREVLDAEEADEE